MKIDYSNLPEISILKFNDKVNELFICALGFEDRCVGSLEELDKQKYYVNYSIMLKYDIHIEDNNKNYDMLLNYLDNVTLKEIYEMNYSISRPDLFYSDNCLKDKISEVIMNNSITNVLVDVSSFNTTAIIQIMELLLSLNLKKLKIIYTEAKEYYPKNRVDTLQGEHLSSGLGKITSLKDFYGYHTPGYSHLLIIILGLEPIRSRGVFNLIQPSKKIGVIGNPSRIDLKWRLNLSKNMYQNFFGDKDEYIVLSEFNYKEVFNNLEILYDKYYQNNNITLTPLGSKMQTIAVLLHLLNHPDIQLLISMPIKYDPKKYSEGIGEKYQIIFENMIFK